MWYGLTPTHEKFEEAIQRVVERINLESEDVAIAVCGSSGLVVGAPVTMLTGRTMFYVRKERESSHRVNNVEMIAPWDGNSTHNCEILIVDDFEETGYTVERMTSILEDKGHKVIGVFFYDWNRDKEDFEPTW